MSYPYGVVLFTYWGWAKSTLERDETRSQDFRKPSSGPLARPPSLFTLSRLCLSPAILAFRTEDLPWVIGLVSPRARLREAFVLLGGANPATRESLSVTYSCLSCWKDPRKFRKCAALLLLTQIKGWNDTQLWSSGISRDTSQCGHFRRGFCNLHMVP